jgi:hypothetical protein
VLAATDKTSQRRRALPTDFLVCYVIVLALFLQDACREVLQRVQEDLRPTLNLAVQPNVAAKSAITQARVQLGSPTLHALFTRLVTRGAWYRQWRLVTLDGTTLATPNSTSNTAAFRHSGSKARPPI